MIGSIAAYTGMDAKDWEKAHMADAVSVLQAHHMDAIAAAADAATEYVRLHCSLLVLRLEVLVNQQSCIAVAIFPQLTSLGLPLQLIGFLLLLQGFDSNPHENIPWWNTKPPRPWKVQVETREKETVK